MEEERKGERGKNKLHAFEFVRVCCSVCVCGKQQREMIKTGVLELVERTGGTPTEGMQEMQDIYLIHMKNTALRQKRTNCLL